MKCPPKSIRSVLCTRMVILSPLRSRSYGRDAKKKRKTTIPLVGWQRTLWVSMVNWSVLPYRTLCVDTLECTRPNARMGSPLWTFTPTTPVAPSSNHPRRRSFFRWLVMPMVNRPKCVTSDTCSSVLRVCATTTTIATITTTTIRPPNRTTRKYRQVAALSGHKRQP